MNKALQACGLMQRAECYTLATFSACDMRRTVSVHERRVVIAIPVKIWACICD